MDRRSSFTLLFLLVALIAAAASAFAQESAVPDVPSPPPAAATSTPPSERGTAPMPDNAAVPAKWLPPGSFADDRGPSSAIFPPQKITLRFNHKKHVAEEGLKCTDCHKRATTSASVQDHLIPSATTCDPCHGTDHGDLNKVQAGDEPEGQCAFCHLGYRQGDGNRVAKLQLPRANMVFNHKKHVARNIGCAQCHGEVQELALATRDQLPRMRGCFSCHQHPDARNRGDAKSACETCHLKGGATSGGRIQTVFASGKMQPPRWMHNAQHTPDFILRHKQVAANDSQFCASCHKEDFCVSCHDGRVRPRNIHPNDYLSMHPVEARLATQRCTSCHREQSFCVQCHQRLGVSRSSPAGVQESSRFHPPATEWTNAPRRPGHHSFEAMRNLNACVSCHVESDCVQCHGASGVGGGFNPHSGGFAGGCASQFQRNPRPCYVCHSPGDPNLESCR